MWLFIFLCKLEINYKLNFLKKIFRYIWHQDRGLPGYLLNLFKVKVEP